MDFLSYRCEEFFRTPDAISYELLMDGPVTIPNTTFVIAASSVVGRIEMLWDANTHIKIYVRVFLHENYAKSLPLPDFKTAVEEFLDDHDMYKYRTYEADLFYVKSWQRVENRVDEFGHVDGAP